MDWMSNRLARLIEEGKKALGQHIVVSGPDGGVAENEDDEDAWVEEGDVGDAPPAYSFPGERRSARARPAPFAFGGSAQAIGSPSTYHTPPATPMNHHLALQHPIRPGHTRTPSALSNASPLSPRGGGWGEQMVEDSMSPSLRDFMEQARAKKGRTSSVRDAEY